MSDQIRHRNSSSLETRGLIGSEAAHGLEVKPLGETIGAQYAH